MDKKSIVRTVLKDIAPAELGWCQCHEHVFLEKGRSFEVHPALCMDDYDKSLAELKLYAAAGGSALVDAQPGGGGRMAERMVAASRESGVHLIASAGFHKTVFYPEGSFLFAWSEDQLARHFIREIRQGMDSSDADGKKRLPARAGILKVAFDRGGLHRDATYEKLFAAAGAAASETGVHVLAHIEEGSDALELIEHFGRYGVGAQCILICHLDRARIDAAYHREVAATGAFLEYDTINRLKYVSHEGEIAMILAMLEAGCEDQLLFSLDTTNQRLKSYGADMGLDYILTVYRPMLAAAGVREETLAHIMYDNAARAVAFEAK